MALNDITVDETSRPKKWFYTPADKTIEITECEALQLVEEDDQISDEQKDHFIKTYFPRIWNNLV